MARKLEDQTGVVADANYINGKLVDGTTVVGEGINQDIVQTVEYFKRINELAGNPTNGLPDNETNGYQIVNGVEEFVRGLSATESERGTARLATTAVAQAGTDDTRIMTPKKVADLTRAEYVDNSGSTNIILKTKILTIGGWDMDTDPLKNVAHGLDAANIFDVTATIKTDTDLNGGISLSSSNASGDLGGIVAYDSTNIILGRTTGGLFDSTTYDDDTINRGYVVIRYLAS